MTQFKVARDRRRACHRRPDPQNCWKLCEAEISNEHIAHVVRAGCYF
jgi:hypothetical protein